MGSAQADSSFPPSLTGVLLLSVDCVGWWVENPRGLALPGASLHFEALTPECGRECLETGGGCRRGVSLVS